MRITTRYLFREIIHYFLVFLSITVVILLVSQFYDSRSAFLENRPPLRLYLTYIFLTLPAELAEVLPLIALISTMFAYGILAKGKEILAMLAAGLSFRRLGRPALVFGLFITGFLYLFNELVVPWASLKARELEQFGIMGKREDAFLSRKDVFVKATGNAFIYMKLYHSGQREMIFPSVFERRADGTGATDRIEADRAVLVSGEKDSTVWKFENAERWQFNDDSTLRHYEKFSGPLELQLGAELDKFLSRAKDPTQMNSIELIEYINLLRNSGGEKIELFETALYQKLAFPFACLLFAVLGYAVVVDVHARRFAQGVLAGLGIAVLFYVVYAAFSNLAKAGQIAPINAGILPIAAFMVVVIILMARLNRVRS